MNDLEFAVKMEEYINSLTPIKPRPRTLKDIVEIIRVMPYQFTLAETEKFVSLLNERLDEILEIYKAESEVYDADCN